MAAKKIKSRAVQSRLKSSDIIIFNAFLAFQNAKYKFEIRLCANRSTLNYTVIKNLKQQEMKHVLISGASRRLGLYLTQKFLELGWHVHALTRKASDDLKALQSDQLTVHELEQYNELSVDHFIAYFQQHFSALDLIINNASIFEKDEQLLARGVKFYEELMFIHMTMPALLVSGLVSELTEAKGSIASITDIYTDNPNAEYSLYCSTKAGLQNLTLGFAKKLAPNIRANCIQPGPIKFLDEHNDAHKSAVLNETLLPFEGGFEPIFQALQFVLVNKYVTGECIKVDGGRALVRG